MFLRFPLGLIFSALLIQWLAVPYMQWAANWKLNSFSAALAAVAPSMANQVGAGIWIPAAGLLLAVGIGLMLATLTLYLVAAAHGVLSTAVAVSRGRA
jgi:ABC-type amino acid transport system permease subunit